MYENKTNSIPGRIVSINQPHVRPIVRGKMGKSVEFGSKVSISCSGGFGFIDMISWDNYNEGTLLKHQIELYKKRHGFYPKEILADKIYRSRENRRLCKDLGIKLSGPPLGRPKAGESRDKYFDEGDRNPVEGKLGEGKRRYGLGEIMGKLPETSEAMMQMIFISMNLNKILREIYFVFVRKWLILFDFKRKLCLEVA
jgi:hypothetical protein